MRLSYKWLQDYVAVTLPPEELAERLTMAGLPVESVTPPVPGLERIVVGEILEVRPHPTAVRLCLCRVDVGEKVIQVVSGAPNLAEGIRVPVALPGVALPGGGVVEERVIAGERSQGLLCSGRELGTEEWGYGDEKGVLILPPHASPGERVDAVLGLDDVLLEFDLTPNRGDCLSAVNIAREVRALTGASFSLPRVEVREEGPPISGAVEVRIQDPELCRRYAARLVRNVRVGPSPAWLQYRLRAAGLRPISNIVDVTNYVMLELGQPLHAFDYDKIAQGKIIVRRARPGERIVTLDGNTRQLGPEMLVIADPEGPLAIAGVMGGQASEVTPETRSVLLESACFDPSSIRRTSKELGLRTESSLRFEKGVDPEGVLLALDRAAQLIEELGAGEVAAGVSDSYVRPAAPLTIRLRVSRVNKILGTRLAPEEIRDLLERLGFACTPCGPAAFLVAVPSYRGDVTAEIDLVEEVARLYGYENIPGTIPSGVLSSRLPGVRSPFYELRHLVTEVAVAAGLTEVVTFSFTGPEALSRLRIPEESPWGRAVRLRNPLKEEHGLLRTLLLPGLLEVASHNCKHGATDLAFFEVGKIFLPGPEGELPEERWHFGVAACGEEDRGWQEPPGQRDFFYVKGVLEEVLASLGIADLTFEPSRALPMLHPGRAARVLVAGEEVGFLGELHPDVGAAYEIPVRLVVAELDLDAVFPRARLGRRYTARARYPGVVRDIALVVPEDVPAARVLAVIREAGGDLLKSCRLFDVYQGPQVPAGKRSLAYSLYFQAPDRTLTEAEVAEAQERIVRALAEEVGATLR